MMYIMITERITKDRRLIKMLKRHVEIQKQIGQKTFWFNVFSKLCKMYGRENYFRRTIN